MKRKGLLYYFIPVLIFLALSFIYFYPILEGKVIHQSDVINYIGMSKEAVEWEKKTGEVALWSNNMFGGMPTYLTINVSRNNLWKYLHFLLTFNTLKPVGMLFLYFFSFYIGMILLGYNPLLSTVGAIAYGFSSYFIIILEPGHITKALAIGYMPLVISSVIATYNKSSYIYPLIFSISLNLQLMVNHFQINYYTFLIIFIYIIIEVYKKIKEKNLTFFLKRSVILLFFSIISISCNITNLLLTYEYGKYSTRGESELTLKNEVKTSGLDRDYILSWSYGIEETLTLLIPNFVGGASYMDLNKNSATYKYFSQFYDEKTAQEIVKNIPTYWGGQPFTSGPVYIGAVVLFLFILGIFSIKNGFKWFAIICVLLSIMLAWGKNFKLLSDLFIDYFPFYNKFRSVTMILVIAEFIIPFYTIYFLKNLVNNLNADNFKRNLHYVFGGFIFILLVLLLLGPNLFNFSSAHDELLKNYGYPVHLIVKDRISLQQKDIIRSIIFITITFLIINLFIKGKLSKTYFLVIIGILILIDLWFVNKRYVNNELFIEKKELSIKPTEVDLEILKDTTYYRVLNLASNTFNDAITSYFHKSIGGYHGAKMEKYQELIEYHISKFNKKVLNMLNTKYIIFKKNDKITFQKNDSALGNAWFVRRYILVNNADEEILALNNFNPKEEIIVDKRYEHLLKKEFSYNDKAKIELIYYSPNRLKYKYSSNTPSLTVFSEIYYDKGWNLYINDTILPHFRCNYVLRGAILPAGEYIVEFKFEPRSYYIGEKISLFSSLLLLFTTFAILFYEFKRKKITNEQQL